MKKEDLLREINICYEYKQQLKNIIQHYKEMIILGNGGSISIASHIT